MGILIAIIIVGALIKLACDASTSHNCTMDGHEAFSHPDDYLKRHKEGKHKYKF